MKSFYMTYEHPWKFGKNITSRRAAFRFFHANAGGIVGQSALGAWDLAKAEEVASDRDWQVTWEYDDFEPGSECAILHDEEGNVLASLGGIGGATDEYRRVVQAELASEALYNETKAWGSCAHAR